MPPLAFILSAAGSLVFADYVVREEKRKTIRYWYEVSGFVGERANHEKRETGGSRYTIDERGNWTEEYIVYKDGGEELITRREIKYR